MKWNFRGGAFCVAKERPQTTLLLGPMWREDRPVPSRGYGAPQRPRMGTRLGRGLCAMCAAHTTDDDDDGQRRIVDAAAAPE